MKLFLKRGESSFSFKKWMKEKGYSSQMVIGCTMRYMNMIDEELNRTQKKLKLKKKS